MHAHCLLVRRGLLILPSLQVVLNGLDHLVAHLRRLGKARAEVALDLLELLAVAFQVAEGDAVGPILLLESVCIVSLAEVDEVKTYACSEGELQVVRDVRAVGDSVVDTLIEQVFVAVEVFGDT